MINRTLLIFLLLTYIPAGYAAEEPVSGEKTDKEKETVSLELSIISRTHELEFLDRALENYIIFQPDIPYVFQAKLFFLNQEIKIATDSVNDIGKESQKVDSSYSDLEYSGFIGDYEYSIYYGKYKGFYVEGQRDVSGDYFNFEEIKTKRYGIDVKIYGEEPRMLSVNNRYSNDPDKLPNLFGTYIFGILYDVSDIKNIPSDPAILSQINNSQFLFFNDLKLTTLSPYAGLIGRLAHDGYFIEAGLSIGFGLQRQIVTLDGVTDDHWDYSFVGLGFASIGKKIHGNGTIGFYYSMDTVEPSVEKNEFAIATVDLSLFYKVYF